MLCFALSLSHFLQLSAGSQQPRYLTPCVRADAHQGHQELQSRQCECYRVLQAPHAHCWAQRCRQNSEQLSPEALLTAAMTACSVSCQVCLHSISSQSEALVTSLPVCRPSSSACSRLALGCCPPTAARGSTGSCTPRQAIADRVQHCQNAWKSYLAAAAHCFIAQHICAASCEHPVARSLLVCPGPAGRRGDRGEGADQAALQHRHRPACGHRPLFSGDALLFRPAVSTVAARSMGLRPALPASKPCVMRPIQYMSSACPPVWATCRFSCRAAGRRPWHTHEAGLHRG